MSNYELYSSTLLSFFEKAKKFVTEKNPFYNEINAFLLRYKSDIESDSKIPSKQLNAEKYFPYMKMIMEESSPRLAQLFLEKMTILINNEFFIGNSTYGSEYFSAPKFEFSSSRPKGDKFELKPRCINLLISTIAKFNEYGDDDIWSTSINIFNHVFSNSKVIIHGNEIGQVISFCFLVYSTCKNQIIAHSAKSTLFHLVLSLYDKIPSKELFENHSYSNPLTTFLKRDIEVMIDQIEINNNLGRPNRSIIPKRITNTLSFSFCNNASVRNESNEPCGKFGWCYICRKTADYYDKDSRMPVCGYQCKELIKEEDESIEKYLNGELISQKDIEQYYVHDCRDIFLNLIKITSSEISLSKKENSNTRAKLLSLELLIEIIKTKGSLISSFTDIIKENLTEILLQNCLSEDEDIFQLSIDLFFNLWLYFRKDLKKEISIFNEKIFLKILDSDNSSYEHKLKILENFKSQAETPQYYIELYANYDCDRNENFLVNRIITALGKIGQGKYTRYNYSAQQIEKLKSIAISTLNTLINSLYNFLIDSYDRKDFTKTESDMNSVSSELTASSLKKLDEDLQFKNSLSEFIDKFNISYKKGISYLKKKKFVREDSIENEGNGISNFLKRYNSQLNKNEIGELLGENNDLALTVLKSFTNSFDFKGIKFITALREYLSTFRLPGEGQKIARIIEYFSNQYTHDNPKEFPDKDIAYYLAFTVLILQTELHNENVKEKMSFEGFVKFIHQQESTTVLKEDYLREIYEEIRANPLSLPEIDAQRNKMTKSKSEQIKLESLMLFKESKQILKYNEDSKYKIICDVEYVSPLMSSIWTPLLACFSVILEENEEVELYSMCIEGMGKTICLLSVLDLQFEKDAVVKALCKITNLFQIKEIKDKNIATIKKILHLALGNGSVYFHSWKNFFEVISQIDFIFVLNSMNNDEKEKYFLDYRIKHKNSSSIDKDLQFLKSNIEIVCRELSSENIEKVFDMTTAFTNAIIIDFVDALCFESEEEVKKGRSFLMQKLIEVIGMNMKRNPEVFKTLWEKCSNLIIRIESIEIKGIDYLRQIIKKYLEQDFPQGSELQYDLFYPLKTVIETKKKNFIRDYAIASVVNLIKEQEERINENGWKIIIEIIDAISREANEKNSKEVLEMIQRLLKKKLSPEIFQNVISSAVNFRSIYPEDVISILSKVKFNYSSDDAIFIIGKLYEVLHDKRQNIQSIAMKEIVTMLYKILIERHEKEFYNKIITKVLSTLVNDELIIENGNSLRMLIEMITDTMKKNPEFFKASFGFFLETIKGMCLNHTEEIASIGVKAFNSFFEKDFSGYIENYSRIVFGFINSILSSTLQNDFLTLDPEAISLKENYSKYNSIIVKNIIFSIVHFNLLSKLQIFYTTKFDESSPKEFLELLSILKKSSNIAIKFNFDLKLRKAIASNYITDHQGSIGLISQQNKSIEEYFNCLLFCIEKLKGERQNLINELVSTSINLFEVYLEQIETYHIEDQEEEEDADDDTTITINDDEMVKERDNIFYHLTNSLLNSVFPALDKIKYTTSNKAKEMNTILIKMIITDSKKIRIKIRELLSQAV